MSVPAVSFSVGLLFLSTGTFIYWQAWVFIVVFMTSVTMIGVYYPLKTRRF